MNATKRKRRPIRIFVSYAHKNQAWFRHFEPLLLPDRGPIPHVQHWSDHKIKAGDEFDMKIRQALMEADIFVCLVSYDFLRSEYITEVEWPITKRRNDRGECDVVPVMLSEMDERDIKHLSKFSPLPAWNKPWINYSPRMKAHGLIRTGLLDAIERARKRIDS
jgi:TIR domain-containing protein